MLVPEEPRPIEIEPDDFIELMEEIHCSVILRPDIPGVEFLRIVDGMPRTYIAVGKVFFPHDWTRRS